MLTDAQRKDIVHKSTERILKTLDTLKGYSRISYMQKLVEMLDDTRLVALDFAIDMTPDLSSNDNSRGGECARPGRALYETGVTVRSLIC